MVISKSKIKIVQLVVLALALTSCAELAPAKEPAQEVWNAAELLCEQDLEQYAEVQQIAGAVQLIQEVCTSMEVAKPYADLILRDQQTRGLNPRAVPRAGAIMAFDARRVQR